MRRLTARAATPSFLMAIGFLANRRVSILLSEGLLFLGDGGAYLQRLLPCDYLTLGTLKYHHTDLLIVSYPLRDYRTYWRSFSQTHGSMQPDDGHLPLYFQTRVNEDERPMSIKKLRRRPSVLLPTIVVGWCRFVPWQC